MALVAGLAVGAAACSSHDGGGVDAPPKGSAPAAATPANTVGGFSMQLPAVTLAPGEESTPCWLVPLEVHGPSRVVGGARLTAPPGLHHGNITTRTKTGDGVRPCDSTESNLGEIVDVLNDKGTVLFASTTQYQGTEWMTFPEGMGFPVADGYEIVAHMHYLNATTQTLTVSPSYEWFTIDETKVTQKLAPFAWANKNFKIPPHSRYTADADCDFDKPMHIVTALPHMHRMGHGLHRDAPRRRARRPAVHRLARLRAGDDGVARVHAGGRPRDGGGRALLVHVEQHARRDARVGGRRRRDVRPLRVRLPPGEHLLGAGERRVVRPVLTLRRAVTSTLIPPQSERTIAFDPMAFKKPDRRSKTEPDVAERRARKNLDRRGGDRIVFDVPVDFTLDDGIHLYAYITDLTPRGVFVLTNSPSPVGTRLELAFKLPTEPTPIVTTGKVRWVRTPEDVKKGRSDKRPAGMGVEFADASAPVVERIAALVERVVYPDVDSERPPR